jgi:DNA repair protein RadD
MNSSPNGSPNGLLVARALEWNGIRAFEEGTESLQSAGVNETQEAERREQPAPLAGFLDSLPPTCDVLRPYQRSQLAMVAAEVRAGCRKIVAQAPTGSGKTHLIAAITAGATGRDLRVLILATRTRLVRQIHERLEEFGIQHGVIAAPLPGLRHNARTVQVASVDTLHRRAIVDKRNPLPGADVVIFDEAHLAAAESRRAILDAYPDALLIGLTATPARKSGRGLGSVFDALISGPSVLDLIGAGMLVPPRVFNVPLMSTAELSAIPKDAANDYQAKELAELLSRPKLTGDVVANWLRIANGKRSIVFACNKAHGAQLVQEFTQAGVAAELLTDNDTEATREEAIARLETGNTTVIVNCFLMSYGVDLPAVEAIVLARPTRSLVMYLQMCGRGMRPSPGKNDFLLIDHGRVVESLGLPHVPREWTLDERRNVNTEAREQHSRKLAEEKPRTCPECQHLWLVSEAGPACRECGWIPAPKPKAVVVEDAMLAELDLDEDKQPPVTPQSPEVAEFYRQAVSWYGLRWPNRWRERPKSGRWWAWSQAREKFGFSESMAMPSAFWNLAPTSPTAVTNGWLKSQLIRYAKRKRAA